MGMTPYQHLMSGLWLTHEEVKSDLKRMKEQKAEWEYEDGYYWMTPHQIYFNSIHVKI